jgi:IS1 family transposase
MGNFLTEKRQIAVLRLLTECNSISSTSRLTGVHRDTITNCLVRFGEACRRHLDREMHDLEFRHGSEIGHLEIDELWAYCRKKKRKVTGEEPDLEEIGEFYLFLALDQESRLIPVHRLDRRDAKTATSFMSDLASRLKYPRPHASDAHNYAKGQYKPIIRISTDAFPPYPEAIDLAFGPYASYAQIVKHKEANELTIFKRGIRGKVDDKDISTSLVERTNLTVRTFMKRLARETLCFSKKLSNLRAAIAVYMANYNYCWRIRTFKTTPAVQACLAPKPWTFTELYHHLRDCWPELFYLDNTSTTGKAA